MFLLKALFCVFVLSINGISYAFAVDPIETHQNIGLLPTSCGDIDGARIVNGNVAKLYEFPWMTLLSRYTPNGMEFRCGGSVINSRYILTAAHCVTDGKKLKKIAGVRVGELDYSTDNDCEGDYDTMICESNIQDIEVEEVIPHESFTGRPPLEGDIALLRLMEPINMTKNAAPICLPVYRDLRNAHLAGKNATIAGWGVTENGTASTKLIKAQVEIFSHDTCSNYYRNDKPLCAGANMTDSCAGGGGPLMVESEFNGNVRLVQFGIVSYGPLQCGTAPDFYTDVTKYMGWILENIRA